MKPWGLPRFVIGMFLLALGPTACDDGGVHYLYKPDAAAGDDAGATSHVTLARPGAPLGAVPQPAGR